MSLQFYSFWGANDSIFSTVSERYQAFQITSSGFCLDLITHAVIDKFVIPHCLRPAENTYGDRNMQAQWHSSISNFIILTSSICEDPPLLHSVKILHIVICTHRCLYIRRAAAQVVAVSYHQTEFRVIRVGKLFPTIEPHSRAPKLEIKYSGSDSAGPIEETLIHWTFRAMYIVTPVPMASIFYIWTCEGRS